MALGLLTNWPPLDANAQAALTMQTKHHLSFEEMHALARHLRDLEPQPRHEQHRLMLAANWCKQRSAGV